MRWGRGYWSRSTKSVCAGSWPYAGSLSSASGYCQQSTRELAWTVAYRLDLLVADAVVVEIKSVESLLSVHEAQVLTYLKLGGWKVGLLINFNVPVLKEGIRRKVLGLEEEHLSAYSASRR